MYRELADIYDRIYGSKDYAAESARVREIIVEHNPGARTLLDVACGTGGHLVHLRQHFECEGLDLSEEMVRLAGSKMPEMTFHLASMTDFKVEQQYDALICLFSAVGHLQTVDRLNAAVSRMAEHLAPGGVLLIEPWIDPEDWLTGHVSMDTFEDEDLKIARLSVAEPIERGRVVMEFLIGTKAGVSRIRDEHSMGWFTRSEYEAAFGQAGLSVHHDSHGLTGRGLYIGTSRA